MALTTLSVSQLNRYVKSVLDTDPRLSEVYVRGEISNFTASQAGHLYFTLKEGDSSVRCVMFSRMASYLRFLPQNSMAVIVRASATLYERDGSFQLGVNDMMPDGKGALEAALAALRQKLEKEGLFAPERKRELPYYPKCVGIVTSENGAAIHDIIRTIERRCPAVTLIIAPALVQGDKAAQSIADAIQQLNIDGESEVIIVGRGGGSQEDLWAFNEEVTVRAVAASKIPIISAVGHENDWTLCDHAADMRAATPTAAAELVLPLLSELKSNVVYAKERMQDAMQQQLALRERKLMQLKLSPALNNPQIFINSNRQRLNNLIQSMYILTGNRIEHANERLHSRIKLLDAVSPLKVLSRGYSITQSNGKWISSSQSLHEGDLIKTTFADGTVYSVITKEQEYDV